MRSALILFTSIILAVASVISAFAGELPRIAATAEFTAGILPVVGSTQGLFGSSWKTAVQLVNTERATSKGRLVFRRNGVEASVGDPAIAFSLAPGQSKSFPDVVAAIGETGLGSLDIVVESGPAPEVSAQVLHDGGASGVQAFAQDVTDPAAWDLRCWGGPGYYPGTPVLSEGISGFLTTTDSPESRFNVGVRSLERGARIVATLRDSSGAILHTVTRTYAPNYFEQTSAGQFLGFPVGANQSIRFAVQQGTAIVYGTATDNRTNDAWFQQVEGAIYDSLDVSAWYPPRWETRRIVPLVGRPHGAEGAWKTAVQLHNPHDSLVAVGRLVFHRAGVQGVATDPSISYELAPGETRLIGDVVSAAGGTGSGSLEMISGVNSPVPVLTARIYAPAESGGTHGVMVESVDPEAWNLSACMTPVRLFAAPVLDPTLGGLIIAPTQPWNTRLSVGFATDLWPVRLNLSRVDADGNVVKTVTRDVPRLSAEQVGAEEVFGSALAVGERIQIQLEGGPAVVYSIATDVRSNDVSVQYAHTTWCALCRQ